MIETLTSILTFVILILVAVFAIPRRSKTRGETVDEYWERFLRESAAQPGLRYNGTCCFELDEKKSDALLKLVLMGRKKATCSSLRSFEAEGQSVPEPGDHVVLTDFQGHPRGVFREVAVKRMRFRDMSWEDAFLEGEDADLEGWRVSHIQFFTEEGKALGYEFSEDMEVVFEIFQLVWPRS